MRASRSHILGKAITNTRRGWDSARRGERGKVIGICSEEEGLFVFGHLNVRWRKMTGSRDMYWSASEDAAGLVEGQRMAMMGKEGV